MRRVPLAVVRGRARLSATAHDRESVLVRRVESRASRYSAANPGENPNFGSRWLLPPVSEAVDEPPVQRFSIALIDLSRRNSRNCSGTSEAVRFSAVAPRAVLRPVRGVGVRSRRSRILPVTSGRPARSDARDAKPPLLSWICSAISDPSSRARRTVRPSSTGSDTHEAEPCPESRPVRDSGQFRRGGSD